MTRLVNSLKLGRPAGIETPAPQKKTALPRSRCSRSSSGMLGPSATKRMLTPAGHVLAHWIHEHNYSSFYIRGVVVALNAAVEAWS
jgi:hypothetical protein